MQLPKGLQRFALEIAKGISAVPEDYEAPEFGEYCDRTAQFKWHSWQRDSLIPRLHKLEGQKGQRLLIHGPPQYGKTAIVSQRYPAWLLGKRPKHRVVACAYNETHAQLVFSQPVQGFMRSAEHMEMFPDPSGHIPHRAALKEWSTFARRALNDGQPSFLAAGLQTGFTGKGVDTLIIDDPYASAAEAFSEAINARIEMFYVQTAGVRVNDDTNIIVMFHRYHDLDFAGRRLIESGWEYIRYPAIADTNEDGSDPTKRRPGELLSPMRSRDYLVRQKETDSQVYFAMFQGKPRPDSAGFFRRGDFIIIHKDQMPPLADFYRGWDLALSKVKATVLKKKRVDHSAGARLGVDTDGSVYLTNVTRMQEEYPDVELAIVNLAQVDERPTHIAIEAVQYQLAATQQLERMPSMQNTVLMPIRPIGTKKERARVWASRVRRGKFYLVKTGDPSQDAWIPGFISECCAFTGSDVDVDDQIDAVSIAMALVYEMTGGQKEEDEPIDPNDHARLARYYAGLGDDDGTEEWEDDELEAG